MIWSVVASLCGNTESVLLISVFGVWVRLIDEYDFLWAVWLLVYHGPSRDEAVHSLAVLVVLRDVFLITHCYSLVFVSEQKHHRKTIEESIGRLALDWCSLIFRLIILPLTR
jgi:hypothetical protein